MSGREKPPENLASRLRHRVTLQQPALTPDTLGGYVKTWEDVAELWAAIEPYEARGRERQNAGKKESRVQHRVTLRYRSGVTPDMRLLHGARALSILSVVNAGEAGERLVLLAEEAG